MAFCGATSDNVEAGSWELGAGSLAPAGAIADSRLHVVRGPGIAVLRGLLLGSDRLIGRACPIKRATSHRIKRRFCAADASSIFTAAIRKDGRRTR